VKKTRVENINVFDRYWLIRERWAVSLMSTPLRNLSRQTAKYLEKKIYSNDDLLIDKGFIWKENRWNECESNQMCIFDANKSMMVESSKLKQKENI
jgi:hypothetical protein